MATIELMEWDFFISHASEDKNAIARPLARYLMDAGYLVWFDEFELNVGDSLRGRIDDGLSKSRFGIVIVSKSFLQKKWPRAELDGLFARDSYDTPRLLPVWHGINAEEVAHMSPLLSARVAAVGDSVPNIGASLVRAALHFGLTIPNENLRSILASGDERQVAQYFVLNPSIVAHAACKRHQVFLRPAISGWLGRPLDFVFPEFQPSVNATDLRVVLLGPVLPGETAASAEVAAAARDFIGFCEATATLGRGRGGRRGTSQSPLFEPGHGGLSGIVEVTIVAGRRADSECRHSPCLSSGSDGIELRSYDWLQDAADDIRAHGAHYEHLRVVGPNQPCSLSELTGEHSKTRRVPSAI